MIAKLLPIKLSLTLLLPLVLILALAPSQANAATVGSCKLSSVLTDSQIKCVVREAGWRGKKQINTATQIVKAESGGKVKAVGSKVSGRGLGLFQISRKYWDISKSCGLSATCNANYAHDVIYKKLGFSAWYGFKQARTRPVVCGGGAVLNRSQIRCVLQKAGWRAQPATIATAIVQAESGGRVRAIHDGGPYAGNYGLFQILKTHHVTKKCLLNAVCNAKEALEAWVWTGFTGWASYSVKSGSTYPYCQYLPAKVEKKTKRCN